MVEIKIVFFVLGSFFGIEDSRIATEKTTITIYPAEQRIQLIQEGLFTVIREEGDKSMTTKQWRDLSEGDTDGKAWAEELKEFTSKGVKFSSTTEGDTTLLRPQVSLTYANEKDLEAMGIWYNAEKNQFSINHSDRSNIRTTNGKRDGNYWTFPADSIITFSVEPFLDMSEQFLKSKIMLEGLLDTNKE